MGALNRGFPPIFLYVLGRGVGRTLVEELKDDSVGVASIWQTSKVGHRQPTGGGGNGGRGREAR